MLVPFTLRKEINGHILGHAAKKNLKEEFACMHVCFCVCMVHVSTFIE